MSKEDHQVRNLGPGQTPSMETARLCAGCGLKIFDRFLLHALDRYWHTNCLKCSCCSAVLADVGPSCFSKAGMILCRNDYIRLFGSSGACAACTKVIPASEFVMRAHGGVYHLKCFTCSACHNQLVPGDRYQYVNGSLFCEHDSPVKFTKSGNAIRTKQKVRKL